MEVKSSKKICVISFDFWGYDVHIVDALTKIGVDATHIKISSIGHKNKLERIKNTFSKIFFNKNLKPFYREEQILLKLKKIGIQDQILVINPEIISLALHEKIKKYTRKYTAYLYDSMDRHPAQKTLRFFDKIFSFDSEDCKKYGFEALYNYNYIDLETAPKPKEEYDVVYLGSFDNRLAELKTIVDQCEKLKLRMKIIIVGKKSLKLKILQWVKSKKVGLDISFQIMRIPHAEVLSLYGRSKVIIDLVRDHQIGLSFRFFEAMGLSKKIITNNKSVKNYDFYNPNNILVVEDNSENINKDFVNSYYSDIPKKIYNKYTIDSWVRNFFEL